MDRWSSCRAAEIVFWITVSAGSADALFEVYSGTQGIHTEKKEDLGVGRPDLDRGNIWVVAPNLPV